MMKLITWWLVKGTFNKIFNGVVAGHGLDPSKGSYDIRPKNKKIEEYAKSTEQLHQEIMNIVNKHDEDND